MCHACLNTLAKLNAIVRANEERRAQEEHGARIAARAEANRSWHPSEMDEVSLQRSREEIAAGFETAAIPEPDPDTDDDPRVNYTGLHE